jgi:N-acetylglucosaminyldiphosphoundecaprenol N-acetyl-beta-D-mannosaminyltransferase
MTRSYTEGDILKDRKQVNILNVKIDSTSTPEVLRKIRARFTKKAKIFIVTPNSEQIILAQKDIKFRHILNSSDISICDAIGVSMAAKFYRMPKCNIIASPVVYFVQGLVVGISTFLNKNWLQNNLRVIKGRELFINLVQLANKKHWKIFLLGGENGVSEKVGRKLRASYKAVVIDYADGPMLDKNGEPSSLLDLETEKKVVSQINDFKPHILFVAFGAPKQEKWLYRWFNKLDIKMGMVVGGTFNFISGKAKLSPKWVSGLGLEWLWRLATGSQKLKRILIAFPVFPIKVYLDKCKN